MSHIEETYVDNRIIKYCLIALELNRFCIDNCANIQKSEQYMLLRYGLIFYRYVEKLQDEQHTLQTYWSTIHEYNNCYPVLLIEFFWTLIRSNATICCKICI